METLYNLFVGVLAFLIGIMGGAQPIQKLPTPVAVDSVMKYAVVTISSSSVSMMTENKNEVPVPVIIPCEDTSFVVSTTSEVSLAYLEGRCNHKLWGSNPFIFTVNGIKKKYGVIIDDPTSKCGCYESLGYFNYDDVNQVEGKLILAASSIVKYNAYSSFSSDFSSRVSVHYFNEVPYLIILAKTGAYTLDPETKKINKILSLSGNEDFCGPDLCTEYVESVDKDKIKIRIYSYASSTKPYEDSSEIKVISLR